MPDDDTIVNEEMKVEEKIDDGGGINEVIVTISLPNGSKITIPTVSTIEASGIINQALREYVESAHYTNYHLEIVTNNDDDDIVVLNDFIEIGKYAILTTLMEGEIERQINIVKLVMVLDNYDIKTVRSHVARVREVIMFPPSISGVVDDAVSKAIEKPAPSFSLPEKNVLFAPIKFSEFFDHTLFMAKNTTIVESIEKKVADCIRSISFSGWNPPPPPRRLQGDLAYLEVVTDEGPIHITAIQNGFFVNKSTRHVFNPTAVTSACFSHELLETLASVSPSCSKSLSNLKESIAEKMKVNEYQFAGVLAPVTQLFEEGRSHLAVQKPQWTFFNNTKHNYEHTFDVYRSQDDMSNSFGIEEKGSSKEWNEEYQAILRLAMNSQLEDVLKHRYLYRLTNEFSECCKTIAVAISDGFIAPINPTEPQPTHAYFYNNIFFSRAIETKESFKLCQGDEANRKAAGQDHKNQKIIQSLNIDGLNAILQCLIDYKGERFVAQTIIPGVLQTGDPNARLMLGALENGKRFCCKTSAFDIMKKLCEHFHMKERNIPAIPIPLVENKIQEKELENSELMQNPIVIDTEEENAPLDSASIPHIGPLEGKILKGADNRLYALEIIRFTPRDANYVKDSKGTGLIAKEYLEAVPDNVAMVYVIRNELVNAYIGRKVNIARLGVLQDYTTKLKELPAKAEGENDTDDVSNPLFAEMSAKLEEITLESVQIDINPNVFYSCGSDVDPAVVEKDEALARDLANFLWTTQLPSITELILKGDLVVIDNESMVKYLHEYGINIRYLGQLARLALEQEEEDNKNLTEGKHRIQKMPHYWLDLLEIEMISRAFKHLLRKRFSDPSIRSAPGETIVSLLNHCFGGNATNSNGNNKVESSKAVTNDLTIDKKGGKKKKGKNGSKTRFTTELPAPKNGAVSREEVIAEVHDEVMSRFSYKLTMVNGNDSNKFLADRISPLTLLRRMCQLLHLKIAVRDYDFESSSPFQLTDIVDLLPNLKSCEPDSPYPATKELFAHANQFLKESNLQAAESCIHEAAQYLSVVTGGTIHKETVTAFDSLSTIYEYSEDIAAASEFASRALLLSVQATGLDSSETYRYHVKLGAYFAEMKNYELAVKHLLTAKYLLELIGTKNHPESGIIYLRLADIYQSFEDAATALECLNEASTRIMDYTKLGIIFSSTAQLYSDLGDYEQAYSQAKSCHSLNLQIFGESHERTTEAKLLADKYKRANIDYKVRLAKEERLRKQTAEEEKLVASFETDNKNVNNVKKGKQRK